MEPPGYRAPQRISDAGAGDSNGVVGYEVKCELENPRACVSLSGMDAPRRFVEIVFDCLPLRSVGRLDVPIDASPKYRQRCERVKGEIERHGSHNAYYLYNASCVFHLTNDPAHGMLEYKFDGTVLTDPSDQLTQQAHLSVELIRETCDWLNQPVVEWFRDTVSQAVMREFDLYIAAGSLEQTRQRIAKLQKAADESGGYVGEYL
jgi:hypothetical protein